MATVLLVRPVKDEEIEDRVEELAIRISPK